MDENPKQVLGLHLSGFVLYDIEGCALGAKSTDLIDPSPCISMSRDNATGLLRVTGPDYQAFNQKSYLHRRLKSSKALSL